MIFTVETVTLQITQMLHEYPDLAIVQSDSQMVRLHGRILVFRTYNDFTMRKIYILDIIIPLGSDELPFIIDTDRQIKQDYHHYYPNGRLCLATDSQIRIRFIDGFNLVEWMSEFVEIYYFSYEYYERFGIFPFGERAHGSWGIIQTYQDFLMAKDEVETYKLMHFIKNQMYRGHHPCPCGSEKPLRNCHGQAMFRFYKDTRIKKIMMNDLISFDKELAKENERELYRKKAK
ncbi:MAG: SEC-C domain-containing protein [Eubacteriales bacterium]|jgi:hypothetical protein